jgi:aspartate carbamoyltransferase catalytic subunit
MGKTIMAMQRVQSIKERREERFHANRMRDAKPEKVKQARVEIEKHVELLAPAVAKREEVLQNVLDSARARIATRKIKAGEKVKARGSGEIEE